MAQFYGALLDLTVNDDADNRFVTLGEGPVRLAFQRAEDFQPPSWPDGLPQQAHLDFEVDDYDEPHRRAVALGAIPLLPVTPPARSDPGFRVYADPTGHPFCLCRR